jgi:CRISPR/Cas system-associated endonuclease Cas1
MTLEDHTPIPDPGQAGLHPMQLLNTLYVTLPESYLRLDNDTLRVVDDAHETRLRVPLHHLQAVVCFGTSA